MIQGSGTISNYPSYISNCTKGQMPYKVPVPSLAAVQLFIDVGFTKPDAIQYQLIHTCGTYKDQVDTLTTSSYVVGQDYNQKWYGVFKNFDSIATPVTCFVIAITLVFASTETIYFSEEYCIDEDCGNELALIKGCYGNVDSRISYDCNDVYFGKHSGDQTWMGDRYITYQHQMYLRNVDISLVSVHNTFNQGRTRTFRTQKDKQYEFLAELVPEWYFAEAEAIFYRGEVIIAGDHYLLAETQFEKVEPCKKVWKLGALFKKSCFQSFSCEADPCSPPTFDADGGTDPDDICCTPTVTSVTSTIISCCTPTITSVTQEII